MFEDDSGVMSSKRKSVESFELRCLEGLLDNIEFIGTEASILLALRIVVGVLGVIIVPVDRSTSSTEECS